MAARSMARDSERNKRIRKLLASSTPKGVMRALHLLESANNSAEAWRAAVTRSAAYSICELCKDSGLASHFGEAMKKDFSRAATRKVVTACKSAINAIASNTQFETYDRFRACQYLAPFGIEILTPNDTDIPVASPDDSPFAAAGIAKWLGQILWRDLALEGRLKLRYLPDSLDGDRLMPECSWRLIDEEESASNSFGCEFICGRSESYFLPWIKKHYFIDPAEIRRDLYRNFLYELPLQESLEPRFTAAGLVHAALEGLCDEHLVLLDEAKFDRKIKKEFQGVDEMLSVRVQVLARPVDRKVSRACFRQLSREKKAWIADLLVHTTGNKLYPEVSALSKHVLGWITLHPSTPTALRKRLTGLGFGVTQKPSKRIAKTCPGIQSHTLTQKQTLDRRRIARLQRIVKAWEQACDADGAYDLGREGFLAAHYAKLVQTDQVNLTKAGWRFIDDMEDVVIDAADGT